VDLHSPKAIQLRAELAKARDAMRKASVDVERATEIAQDGSYRSSDGTHGLHKAAERYLASTKEYHMPMTAWVQHIVDS